MFRTILGLFGYVKIPLAAIQLSLMQETFFEKVLNVETDQDMIAFITPYLAGQKALTAFLRSGKLLS